jgi:hypothetical protein
MQSVKGENTWGTALVVLLLTVLVIVNMTICTKLPTTPKSTPVEVPVIKDPDTLKNSLDELTR